MNTEIYANPLIDRYATSEMSRAFSANKRYGLWRTLWIALAESEKELGLNITDEQIKELKKYEHDIDFNRVAELEKEVRHDVMAHVKAYGEKATTAKGIIHLGATSCYVTDNAEIIMVDDALTIIIKKLVNVINNLKNFALKYKDLPTLGYTHLQPAQLTTVGKRATLWLNDLVSDYEDIMYLKSTVKLRGVKGTTGTQASFMELFDNDESKVKELEKRVAKKLGYNKVIPVTGQTYSRKFDYSVLSVLSKIAQSAYKFANDLRLLQSMKEMEEPFESTQIGSSAMAYKRNPMRSERICSLARYVISAPVNMSITSSTQWLERTLDDSANKRIVTAESFLAVDGILNLYMNITENMVVYDKVIEKRVKEELPFMATENIIMEGVKAGGDRQELHEKIRRLSMEAGKTVKVEGKPNNLIELIKADKTFDNIKDKIGDILVSSKYVGRAPSQVVDFITEYVEPILNANAKYLGASSKVSV